MKKLLILFSLLFCNILVFSAVYMGGNLLLASTALAGGEPEYLNSSPTNRRAGNNFAGNPKIMGKDVPRSGYSYDYARGSANNSPSDEGEQRGNKLEGASDSTISSDFSQDSLQSSGIKINPESRIRTLVFDENIIFKINTRYGYQTSLEFANDEEIQTISVGNSVAFTIMPVGKRLFIKTMINNQHTNMTVVTTKRTYQFELDSNKKNEAFYVVRFFYPEARHSNISSISNLNIPDVNIAIPEFQSARRTGSSASGLGLDYNYTMAGAMNLAPSKIFNNGRQVFIEFPQNVRPAQINIVQPDGSELPSNATQQGEYLVISSVPAKISLRNNNQVLCIFSE